MDKKSDTVKFIEKLYQAVQDQKAADTLGKLISLYASKPGQKATTPKKRLSELADLAEWRSTDPELPKKTRLEFLKVARTIDILATGKTSRPASLPEMRRATVERL